MNEEISNPFIHRLSCFTQRFKTKPLKIWILNFKYERQHGWDCQLLFETGLEKRGGSYGMKKGVYENKQKMRWGNSTKILEGVINWGYGSFVGGENTK